MKDLPGVCCWLLMIRT